MSVTDPARVSTVIAMVPAAYRSRNQLFKTDPNEDHE